MTIVSLENPSPGIWHVGQECAGGKVLETDFYAIGIEKNDALAQNFADRIQDPYWKLELTKSIAEDFAMELAQAEQVLQNHALGIATSVSTENPTILTGLLQRGLKQKTSVAYARIIVGFLIALAVWILSLLRFGFSSGTVPATTSHCFALHSEVSNRTRHLLPPQFSPPKNAVYLLLGRPKKANGVRDLLPFQTIIRPISLSAGLRSFPAALGCLETLVGAIRQTGYTPGIRALAGMFYRQFLGCCQQVWWQGSSLRPKRVVFGHTGLADTARLENMMQTKGAETVHLVHGISVGWNFAAASTTAMWKCGADVLRHRGLYGYDHNTSIAMDTPKPLMPCINWVVFSNYLHPTHPAYLAGGSTAEVSFINLVGRAAQKASPRPKVQWKLHPAFEKCDKTDILRVQSALSKQGFSDLVEPAELADLIRDNTVITTPSTIVLDALALGRLPIIAHCYPFAKTTAYRQFPLVAGDSDGLLDMVQHCSDPQKNAALYDAAFTAIAPAGRFELDQVEGGGCCHIS